MPQRKNTMRLKSFIKTKLLRNLSDGTVDYIGAQVYLKRRLQYFQIEQP